MLNANFRFYEQKLHIRHLQINCKKSAEVIIFYKCATVVEGIYFTKVKLRLSERMIA